MKRRLEMNSRIPSEAQGAGPGVFRRQDSRDSSPEPAGQPSQEDLRTKNSSKMHQKQEYKPENGTQLRLNREEAQAAKAGNGSKMYGSNMYQKGEFVPIVGKQTKPNRKSGEANWKRMGRIAAGLFVAASLLGNTVLDAQAENYFGKEGWSVSFTAENAMESNFKTADMNDAVSGLQPGDSITFGLDLKNENATATDWYMTNKVLYSLEDRSANSATAGGAYEYVLTYKDHNGAETVLFSSDTVGGDNVSQGGEGLHEATGALEEYFYLDTLTNGQAGRIQLVVSLDGETQGNDYQDTLADLQMNFAVELNENPPTTVVEESPGPQEEPPKRTNIVKTSDESDLRGLFIAMAVSGTLLLAMAIYSLRQGRRQKMALSGGPQLFPENAANQSDAQSSEGKATTKKGNQFFQGKASAHGGNQASEGKASIQDRNQSFDGKATAQSGIQPSEGKASAQSSIQQSGNGKDRKEGE